MRNKKHKQVSSNKNENDFSKENDSFNFFISELNKIKEDKTSEETSDDYDDGLEHCKKCGGPLWDIHDPDTGLILYKKCGFCREIV